MSSVRKIASSLGVSVATVSRALNNHPDVSTETRQRVLEAAQSAGYLPQVGKRQMTVIGLVYPNSPVRPDYGTFESMLLAGIVRGANERRFDVTIINLEQDRDPLESYTQFFHRKGVRGVVIRSLQTAPRFVAEIAEERFPSVLVADRSEDPRVNFIDSESKQASRQAVEHLISLGHTRIGLAIHNVLDSDHQDREDGYAEALREAGIARDPQMTVRAPASPEGGAMMLNRLLEHESPPTAVYFTNPLSTVGALHRCLQLGIRVPKDLSIVGFDDGDVRLRTFPNFTAVCQDAHALGMEAARWMTRALEQEPPGVFRELRQTRFAVHESTGLRPAAAVRIVGPYEIRREI